MPTPTTQADLFSEAAETIRAFIRVAEVFGEGQSVPPDVIADIEHKRGLAEQLDALALDASPADTGRESKEELFSAKVARATRRVQDEWDELPITIERREDLETVCALALMGAGVSQLSGIKKEAD